MRKILAGAVLTLMCLAMGDVNAKIVTQNFLDKNVIVEATVRNMANVLNSCAQSFLSLANNITTQSPQTAQKFQQAAGYLQTIATGVKALDPSMMGSLDKMVAGLDSCLPIATQMSTLFEQIKSDAWLASNAAFQASVQQILAQFIQTANAFINEANSLHMNSKNQTDEVVTSLYPRITQLGVEFVKWQYVASAVPQNSAQQGVAGAAQTQVVSGYRVFRR